MATELPLLDQVGIASPCSVPWEIMRGDERVRHCDQCRKHVYNFAEMTREEIAQLIQENEGHLCGRMYRRADGTLLTSDCPVGLRTVRQRLIRATCGLAAMMLALIGGMVWGRGWTRTSSTGVNIVDDGPLSKFTRWVEPQREVFLAGAICVREVPAPGGETDSAGEH
jgi:hypothetical protein